MDEPHRQPPRRLVAWTLVGVVLLTLVTAVPSWGATQFQQRFSGILLLESQCDTSLPVMAWALETLSLNYTAVTTWADLDQALNSGPAPGLVMISAYNDLPTASYLTSLNNYLVGVEDAFVIFAQHSIPAGLRSHPLWTTLGITVLNDLPAPSDVSPKDTLAEIFNTPTVLRRFAVTDTASCSPHGQAVTPNPRNVALAVFDADSTRAAIVFNEQGNALYHAFMPADYLDDANSDGLQDIIELYQNELIFFAGLSGEQVTAIYAGGPLDTISASGARLEIVVLGGSGATSANLVYRFGGQSGYSGSLPLTVGQVQSSIMGVDLPLSILNARGLEFYFNVTRGSASTLSGSPSDPFIAVIDFTTGRPAPRALTLPDGAYRIVSVPIDIVGDSSVDAVIVDDLGDPEGGKQWRLFQYDPVRDSNIEYGAQPLQPVVPKRSYWLAARGGRSYSAVGLSRRPNRLVNGASYYELPLDSGWNHLANPLPFPVDWDSALIEYGNTIQVGHPDSLLRDVIYQWLGGRYSMTQRVDSWLGFFVEVRKRGVKALFRYRASTAAGAASHGGPTLEASALDGWSVELRLEDERYYDDGNFAGVRTDAGPGADAYDYPDPPRGPVGVRLSFQLPEGPDRRPHRTDYRAPFTESEEWHLEFSSGQARQLVITGLNGLPAGMQALLILDAGQVFDLSEGEAVSIPDDSRSGRLMVGTSAATEQERSGVRPESFALHQNFPNPFNPRTTIRFALPEPGPVRIRLFDVLGRQIRVLADQSFAAGVHDLQWDGTDRHGRSVGSGVYFYRIDASSFTARRKLLLLK